MPRCGEHGFTTKAGKPCGYLISDKETCCPHHDEDKSRAKAFQSRGGTIANIKELPGWIDTNEFQSTQDIKRTLSAVVREVSTNVKADLKRATVIIQACNAASTVLNTEAVGTLNDTIMRAEGHGPALVILEGLKQGRTRRLPGVVERTAKQVNE